MHYYGELYGKAGSRSYFPTGKTGSDWDDLEKERDRIAETIQLANDLVERWRMIASEIEKKIVGFERNIGYGPSPEKWKTEAIAYRRCANDIVELFHKASQVGGLAHENTAKKSGSV